MNNGRFIYFNNAATSFPKAPGLGEIFLKNLNKIPQHFSRTGYYESNDELYQCRDEIAKLLNTSPKKIILTKNATEAANIAIYGLNLKNQYVLTTVVEHNSILRPLYYLERKNKIKLLYTKCDKAGRVDLNDWKILIEKYKPKVCILNHSSNVTGAINNPKEFFDYAKRYNCITILDSSQTIGLLNINPELINADLIIFTGHKYLLGPPGTGGMYLKNKDILEPIFVGGSGIKSELKSMPNIMPIKFEPGTPNIPAFEGLAYSIRWLKGNPNKLDKIIELLKYVENNLLNLDLNVIKVESERTPIISFTVNNFNNRDIGFILEKAYGIICRVGLHCAPLIHKYIGTYPNGTIRLSFSQFNNIEEIDYLIDALKIILYENKKNRKNK